MRPPSWPTLLGSYALRSKVSVPEVTACRLTDVPGWTDPDALTFTGDQACFPQRDAGMRLDCGTGLRPNALMRTKQRGASVGKPNHTHIDTPPFVPIPGLHPANFEPVIMVHPPLDDASRETVEIFTKRLTANWEEVWRRIGADPSKAEEQLRDRLFESAKEKVMPLQRLKFLMYGDNQERARAFDEATQDFQDHVLHQLSMFPPRVGPNERNADRDELVYELHKSGQSYGQIARKLNAQAGKRKITRQGVEAACRREKERRQKFYQHYLILKTLFHPFGLLLVEEPTK